MNLKTLGLVLVVVVIAIAAGASIFSTDTVVKETVRTETVGASAGPEFTETQYFFGGATYGSGCLSTTTTGTLTAKDLQDNSCIRIAAVSSGAQAALSLTLPATTTMSNLLPKTGSCRQWFVDADGVAAATTTTIVAGAGHIVVGLDATGAGTGADVIDGDEFGRITSCRLSTGDVVTTVQEYIHAD